MDDRKDSYTSFTSSSDWSPISPRQVPTKKPNNMTGKDGADPALPMPQTHEEAEKLFDQLTLSLPDLSSNNDKNDKKSGKKAPTNTPTASTSRLSSLDTVTDTIDPFLLSPHSPLELEPGEILEDQDGNEINISHYLQLLEKTRREIEYHKQRLEKQLKHHKKLEKRQKRLQQRIDRRKERKQQQKQQQERREQELQAHLDGLINLDPSLDADLGPDLGLAIDAPKPVSTSNSNLDSISRSSISFSSVSTPPSMKSKPKRKSNSKSKSKPTTRTSPKPKSKSKITKPAIKKKVKIHPDFRQKITQMARPLHPLVSYTTGHTHPSFPKTLLSYNLLTSSQLDSLALHFHQVYPPTNESFRYPLPVKPWITTNGFVRDLGVDVEVKRRRFGRFIGLRGCESPTTTGEGDVIEKDVIEKDEVVQEVERDWERRWDLSRRGSAIERAKRGIFM